jgi:hypothetical protein
VPFDEAGFKACPGLFKLILFAQYSMTIIESIHAASDQHIRLGEIEKAKGMLKPLLKMRLNASDRERSAELFRRVGLHRQSLQVLRPVVLGYGRMLPTASTKARIEYGAALIQMDLVEEGRKFLELPQVKNHRDAKRWHALSFLHDFQFSRAAEGIAQALKEYDSKSYDHLVLQVNLMVALLADLYRPEVRAKFQAIASEVENAIDRHQAERLRSVYHSLMTQSVFFSDSKKGLSLSKESPRDYQDFFAAFTALFHEGRAGRVSRKAVDQEYEKLRQFARERYWFEGIREIDLHYSRLFQTKMLAWVKVGTRHAHYQNRFLKDLALSKVSCMSREASLLQLNQAATGYDMRELPEPPKLRQLFQLFYSEQYAPLSPYVIWSVLAKDEHFIEPHSTNRVHQWVKRLKAWIKQKKIPAQIVSGRQGYRLIPIKPLSCDLVLFQSASVDQDLLEQLKRRFQGKAFSIREVIELNPEVSIREIQNRLKTWVEGGAISKSGKARAVRYTIQNQ